MKQVNDCVLNMLQVAAERQTAHTGAERRTRRREAKLPKTAGIQSGNHSHRGTGCGRDPGERGSDFWKACWSGG